MTPAVPCTIPLIVSDEDVVAFLGGPARDAETERMRVLTQTRLQALSDEQILRAVGGPVTTEQSSIFPTAMVSDVPVPAHSLTYVDRITAVYRRKHYRGDIGTLPLVMRILRVSVWLVAGALMLLGMIRN
jgi:hypothetical protein